MSRRRKLALLLGAAAMVVMLVGAGIAVAAIPDNSTSRNQGVITACMKSDGSIRLIDAQAGDTCKTSEDTVAWNRKPIVVIGDAFTEVTPGSDERQPLGRVTLTGEPQHITVLCEEPDKQIPLDMTYDGPLSPDLVVEQTGFHENFDSPIAEGNSPDGYFVDMIGPAGEQVLFQIMCVEGFLSF